MVGETTRVAGEAATPLCTKPSDQVSVQGPVPFKVAVSVVGLPAQIEAEPVTAAGIAQPMSRRPQPKTLFGRAPAALLQVVVVRRIGTADDVRRVSIASTFPLSEGNAERRRATPPATWGPAIEVPLFKL